MIKVTLYKKEGPVDFTNLRCEYMFEYWKELNCTVIDDVDLPRYENFLKDHLRNVHKQFAPKTDFLKFCSENFRIQRVRLEGIVEP